MDRARAGNVHYEVAEDNFVFLETYCFNIKPFRVVEVRTNSDSYLEDSCNSNIGNSTGCEYLIT